MKVIYKKTILDKLDEVIVEAKKQNKIIEKVQLPRVEWDEFIKLQRTPCISGYEFDLYVSILGNSVSYKGILLECVN